MRTYLRMSECPFQIDDRVKCHYTKTAGTVTKVEDDIVFVTADDGTRFYRNWTHNLDTLMHKSGGDLTREHRGET